MPFCSRAALPSLQRHQKASPAHPPVAVHTSVAFSPTARAVETAVPPTPAPRSRVAVPHSVDRGPAKSVPAVKLQDCLGRTKPHKRKGRVARCRAMEAYERQRVCGVDFSGAM